MSAHPFCHTCRNEIGVGRYVSANGNDYHPDCFKCNSCASSLVGISFALNERNVPICTNCAIEATRRAHPNSKVDVIHSNKPSTVDTSGPVPPPRGNYASNTSNVSTTGNFCSRCGSRANGKFCSSCGTRV